MQNEAKGQHLTAEPTGISALPIQESHGDQITFVEGERCGSCLRFRISDGACRHVEGRDALSPIATCPAPESHITMDLSENPVCPRCGAHMRYASAKPIQWGCPWCGAGVLP